MKLSSSIYRACVFSIAVIFVISLTSNVQAQDATNDTTPPPPGSTALPPGPNTPPPPQQNGQTPSSPVARIRATVENIAGKNRELRNTELQGRENGNSDSSTTPPGLGGRPFPSMPRAGGNNNNGSTTAPFGIPPRDNRMMGDRNGNDGLLQASSTNMFKRMKSNAPPLKKMDAKSFGTRRAGLLQELTVALTNLDTIALRIDSNITKAENAGQSMTDVRALFTTAQDKLAQAKIDVATFTAFTANATSSTQVDLTKPRTEGDTAIKSVKDARDAMKQVLDAFAKALGLDITPPPEATSTNPTN